MSDSRAGGGGGGAGCSSGLGAGARRDGEGEVMATGVDGEEEMHGNGKVDKGEGRGWERAGGVIAHLVGENLRNCRNWIDVPRDGYDASSAGVKSRPRVVCAAALNCAASGACSDDPVPPLYVTHWQHDAASAEIGHPGVGQGCPPDPMQLPPLVPPCDPTLPPITLSASVDW